MPDRLVNWVDQRVLLKPESDIQLIIDVLACEVDSNCTHRNWLLWSGQWKLHHKPEFQWLSTLRVMALCPSAKYDIGTFKSMSILFFQLLGNQSLPMTFLSCNSIFETYKFFLSSSFFIINFFQINLAAQEIITHRLFWVIFWCWLKFINTILES